MDSGVEVRPEAGRTTGGCGNPDGVREKGWADRSNHTGEQGHTQGTEKTTWESDGSESWREGRRGRPSVLKLKGTGAFIRSKRGGAGVSFEMPIGDTARSGGQQAAGHTAWS